MSELAHGSVIMQTSGALQRMDELETVKCRIRKTRFVFPRESAWIDPDCVSKTRTVDEVTAKMELIVEAAKSFRN